MKKFIASIIIAMTLLLLLPTIAFAGTPASTTNAATINYRKYVTGSESMITTNLNWTTNNVIVHNNYSPDGSSDSNYSNVIGVVRKFKINTKGTFELSASALSLAKSVTVEIYRNSISNSTKLGSIYISNYDLNPRKRNIFLPKSGTYYLVAYTTASKTYQAFTNYDIAVKLGFSGVSANKSLTANKYAATSSYEKNTVWYKIRPTKTGYISVTGKNLTGYITMYNSNKKTAYSDRNNGYINTNSQTLNIKYFGVKANTTYYLKVENNARYEGFYQIKFTNTKQLDMGGSNKNKAKTMKRNSTYSGNVTPGGETDWFKISNTSSKNIKLILNGKMTGDLKITVYKGNKVATNRVYFNGKDERLLSYYATYPNGTYYIKVEGYDKKATGTYSFKWDYR